MRHLRECLTTVRASHDSRKTFARVSYDVRASFIFSQLSLEMVLIDIFNSLLLLSFLLALAINYL